MKEYLKNKYKKAKQFSIAGGISEYDWLRFEAIRKQANADRLGEVFKRLTPPFASNIRLSTAEFESLDLISDGPIEGFFNSQGESCDILEASYYDDTVIAEPGVSKVTFDNLTYEKISGASSEFKEFVTGKLEEYVDELKHRFVHRNGAKRANDLEAFGSDFIKPNSEYNINPYNLDTFRGGYLAAKASIDEALNETTPTDVRKCDATIAWNPGLDNNNNLVTTLGKGINSEVITKECLEIENPHPCFGKFITQTIFLIRLMCKKEVKESKIFGDLIQTTQCYIKEIIHLIAV